MRAVEYVEIDAGGGLRAVVAAEVRAALEPAIRPLAALRADPSVATLKSGRAKVLLRAPCPGLGGDLLVKVFRCARAWDRLRYAFVRSKGRLELDRARELLRRGVPTLPPVAVAERRGPLGILYESAVFVRARPDLRDLRADLAAAAGDPAARRALVEAYGRLLRRAHEAGAFQEDPGPNNVLVEAAPPSPLILSEAARRASPESKDGPRLHLIDLERLRLLDGPLPVRLRARNLATLAFNNPEVPPRERALFLRAYAGGDRALARALAGATRAAYGRYVRRQRRRGRRNAVTESRFIARIAAAGGRARGFLRRRFVEEEPERLAPEGIAPLLEAIALGEAPARASVAAASPDGPAVSVCVQRFAARPWPLPEPGLAIWIDLNRLLKLGRAEALPVAYVARRVGLLSREGYLVTADAPPPARAVRMSPSQPASASGCVPTARR